MSISFYCEDVYFPVLDFAIINKLLKHRLRIHKLKLGTINYIFCSDNYLLKINQQYLNHDYFTDVITFDYTIKLVVSADIYISTERVLNNSIIFDQSFSDELVRVISHGFLHLLGYNDKKSEEKILMKEMEDEMISKFKDL